MCIGRYVCSYIPSVGVFIDAILCAILVAKDGVIIIGVNEGEYLVRLKLCVSVRQMATDGTILCECDMIWKLLV